MNLLYFILIAYGITQILVCGSIFDKIRPKHKFFHCPMCIGFWVGVFLCLINPFCTLYNYDVSFVNCFLLGSLSSGTSYVLYSIFGDNGPKLEILVL